MSDEPTNVTRIPVVDDKDFDGSEIVALATQELLDNRKKELSNKVAKLFHKADQLASDVRKYNNEAEKAQKKLDKTVAAIDRLKSGDWTVLAEIEKETKDNN